MKKKFISCLCMAIAVMSLFGCGDSAKTDNNSTPNETVTSVEEKENTTKKADERQQRVLQKRMKRKVHFTSYIMTEADVIYLHSRVRSIIISQMILIRSIEM